MTKKTVRRPEQGDVGFQTPNRSLFTLATDRRFTWAIIGVWLLIGVVTLPFIGKLQDATANAATAFLPHGSESVRFEEAQQQLASRDLLEVSVLYRREVGQLTDLERQRAEAARARLIDVYDIRDAQPVAFSNNGHSALVKIAVPDYPDDDAQHVEVERIREVVGDGGGGLDVLVTGPSAFVADAEAIYSKVDLNLLLGTAVIVTIVLLVTYRSPVLWLIPLISVLLGDGLASALMYFLATNDVLTLDGQSAGILPVLVFGVGTDYALLLIARYREELRLRGDARLALNVALRRAGRPLLHRLSPSCSDSWPCPLLR